MGELLRGQNVIKVQYKLLNINPLVKANMINAPSEDEDNPYKPYNHTRVLQVMVMP